MKINHSIKPDAENPDSFPTYADYLRADSREVSSFMFERSEVPLDSFTVDTSDYTSAEFHQLEKEAIWSRTWLAACRLNDIPEVGDFVEFSIVNWSIIVVRSDENTVQAFHNACRHRGAQVANGCGNVPHFNCPFHAWTYRLDGTLKEIPGSWDFEYLDKESHGLKEVQCDQFDGWVYINLDLKAPSLADYLGETITRHFSVHPDTHFWKSWHFGRVVPSNWKVMAEAFYEAYHIPRTHPSLRPSGGDLNAQYDSYGLHHRLCTVTGGPSIAGGQAYSEQEILDSMLALSGARFGKEDYEPQQVDDSPLAARRFIAESTRAQLKKTGVDLSNVSDAEITDGILYGIFPNFLPFKNPAGHQAYRFRPNGDDPHSCIYEVMNLVPIAPDQDLPRDVPLHMLKPGEKLEDYSDQLGVLGMLLDQDVSNSELIQNGMQSLDYINLGSTQEANIVHLHRNIHDMINRHLSGKGEKIVELSDVQPT